MKKRNAIIVVGYYGENFGDLLMLKALLASLPTSASPVRIFSYGDVRALDRFLKEHFPRSDITIVKPGIWAFIAACKGASQAVWGGGTCFMDEGGTGGVKYLAMARLLGVRVRYLGIGVDRCRSIKTRMSLWIATRIADEMLVRDEGSAEAIRRVRRGGGAAVKKIPDLAMAMHHSDVENRQGAVLCLRDLDSYYDPITARSINRKLCDLLLHTCWKQSVAQVRVLVADEALDAGVSREAADYLVASGIHVDMIAGWNLDASIDAVAGSRFVVSARLHVGVVAQLAATPFVLFNYSEKNRKFCQTVGQLKRCLDLSSAAEWEVDMAAPDRRISELLRRECADALEALQDSR